MRRNEEPATFIENGFPVDGLHRLAMNEGNSKRPIYQIHKWWARRLGSVFRTLLISSFLKPHESEKDFWAKYYNGFALKNITIYDPFMGGGTSVIEALRLGCKVIGSDINPVAWFVTKKEVEHFDEEEANRCYEHLEETVGSKIKELYKTECSVGHDAETIYAMWVRRIKCKRCGNQHDLFNNFIIREKGRKKTIVCPECDQIFSTKSKSNNVECRNCKKRIRLNNVPTKKGVFHCPDCGRKESVSDAALENKAPLPARMICIEFYCDICGRGYKMPTEDDLRLFKKARKEFEHNKHHLEYPNQKIPLEGRADMRPASHGFQYFYQLFNERQLLALSLLLKEIKKIKDDSTREFFILNFSSSLETNNVLCKYETKWGKIGALFGIPAYHVPDRFAENNLWGLGRGTFPRSYQKLKRGKKFGTKPFERILIGGDGNSTKNSKRQFVNEVIATEVNVKNFDMTDDKRALLLCGDSRKPASIRPNSVDAVITDPPYFDTIMYSELADFFYVWLRLGLKDRYEWFREPYSQRKEEIVVNNKSGKDRELFIDGFSDVLKNLNKVLKDDGLLVFTFHHTKKWAWEGLRKAIYGSGFNVSAAHIIRSEGKTGYRKGNNTSYDVCIVCRKKDFHSSSQFEEMLKGVIEKVKVLKKLDNELRDSDIFTAIMSNYVRTDEDSAAKIMGCLEPLMADIKKKV